MHRDCEAGAHRFAGLDFAVPVDPGNRRMPCCNVWKRFADPLRRRPRLRSALRRRLPIAGCAARGAVMPGANLGSSRSLSGSLPRSPIRGPIGS